MKLQYVTYVLFFVILKQQTVIPKTVKKGNGKLFFFFNLNKGSVCLGAGVQESW